MRRKRAKRVMRGVIAHMLVIAMIFSTLSPFVAQGLEIALAERLVQEKWRDILQ